MTMRRDYLTGWCGGWELYAYRVVVLLRINSNNVDDNRQQLLFLRLKGGEKWLSLLSKSGEIYVVGLDGIEGVERGQSL